MWLGRFRYGPWHCVCVCELSLKSPMLSLKYLIQICKDGSTWQHKVLVGDVGPLNSCQFTSQSLTCPLGMGLVAKGLQKQFERFARQLLPVALARINDKSTLARAAGKGQITGTIWDRFDVSKICDVTL